MLNAYLLAGVGLCALLCVMQARVVEASLASSLQKLKVSPDLVPHNLDLLKVEVRNKEIKPGDLVPAQNFQEFIQGKLSWDESASDRYTLILVDLDRFKNRTKIYNQYISINIPGNAIGGGQAIVAFDSPSVECEPGKTHRLLLVAYLQRQNIDIMEMGYLAAASGNPTSRPKRERDNLKEFAIKHDLTPVAANIFLAQGETNGVCSAATASTQQWSVATTLISIITVMTVMALQVDNRKTL